MKKTFDYFTEYNKYKLKIDNKHHLRNLDDIYKKKKKKIKNTKKNFSLKTNNNNFYTKNTLIEIALNNDLLKRKIKNIKNKKKSIKTPKIFDFSEINRKFVKNKKQKNLKKENFKLKKKINEM